MRKFPYALYDAFSDKPFGGSQGGIILNAEGINANQRLQIAKELGLPAVCFVSAHSKNSVTARFQSTQREYLMCGHGTICLMTYLLEQAVLSWNGHDRIDVNLQLPTTNASVEIYRRGDNRSIVMLDISVPKFHRIGFDASELANVLGIRASDFANKLPIESALGDFAHLIVPVTDLATMKQLTPDFSRIARFCRSHGFETIACFCTETEQIDYDIHVRDFCPAVGVPESAAAGTTNAALSCYLIRHDLAKENVGGKISIKAEQGMEINRPSTIQSTIRMKDNKISRLQVGGVATKIFEGDLYLPT